MGYKYDVFPSFRGHDVRKGFVDHLDHALTSAGFRAFLDTRDVNSGDDISATLEHAVERSRVLIPIFSPNYAQSYWCLRESSLIARRVRKGSAIAIPVFYDVTPSQVRRPERCGGPFGLAFEEHEKSGRYSAEEIREWKDALFQLCRLSGYSLQDDFNGSVTHSYHSSLFCFSVSVSPTSQFSIVILLKL